MKKGKTLIAYRPFFKFKKYEIEFYRKASEFFLLNVIQFWNNIDENLFEERNVEEMFLSSFNPKFFTGNGIKIYISDSRENLNYLILY